MLTGLREREAAERIRGLPDADPEIVSSAERLTALLEGLPKKKRLDRDDARMLRQSAATLRAVNEIVDLGRPLDSLGPAA